MKSTRAYRAGQHVHNFFGVIGTTVATGVITVKNTVRDFAVGVKDGGDAENKETKPRGRGAPARA